MFKNGVPHCGIRQFWNGANNIATPEILADVSSNIDVGLVFNDDHLNLRFEIQLLTMRLDNTMYAI